MPDGESMPVEVVYHELAETYHISPIEVENWPIYKINCYSQVINSKRAGEKYRAELEKLKARP